jgi:hypothetical protein
MLIDEKHLVCGMCHRRICDIAIVRGDVALLRVTQHGGIPQQVPQSRGPRMTGGRVGEKPRDPNVQVYADESGESRFRIVHEHKRNGRGTLDRTVKASTLEKLYNDAVAVGNDEVVLR